MNSKLKQLLSLFFMICLITITGYFIFKDQSIGTLLETIESVNPLYLILGLGMMFTFVGCEAFNTFSILRALGQKFLTRNVLALHSLDFILARLLHRLREVNLPKCFI